MRSVLFLIMCLAWVYSPGQNMQIYMAQRAQLGGPPAVNTGCEYVVNTFPYTESFEGSIGLWTQDLNNDIDWLVASSTPSGNTGPQSGAADGSNFIFVECSGNYYKNARIVSPCFDLSGLSTASIFIDYLKYGGRAEWVWGSVRIEISEDDGVRWNEIFIDAKHGESLDSNWYTLEIPINDYLGVNGVKFRISRLTGNSYQQDYALDNFRIDESTDDVTPFITATGITDPTQIDAITDLVTAFKTHGLWHEMEAIYPMMGGTANTHKYNLKDPRDLDEAYRITWSGMTHTANGADPGGNGSGDHGNTHITGDDLLDYSLHVSYYMTESTTPATSGANRQLEFGTNDDFYLGVNFDDTNSYFSMYSADVTNQPMDSKTYVTLTRTNQSVYQVYDNEVFFHEYNGNANTASNTNDLWIGGTSVTNYYSDRNVAFVTVGKSLSQQQINDLNQIVENYQDRLNRSNKNDDPLVKAFPSAKGHGQYASGGRGGQVIKVTNLNNSGAGSLREALETTGPRIIVFDVSGVINLTSMIELTADNSNFTVAGHTAPQGGVTIAGRPIQLGGGYNKSNQPCNNAVFRYLRFRNASYTGVDDVYMHNGFISTGTKNLIFDHCSFSFNDDQAISMSGIWGDLTDITIQNSIFSENATGIIMGNNNVQSTGRFSVIRNLFVDQSHRMPNMDGSFPLDVLNNVIFNWESRGINLNGGSPNVNHIGNYYIEGGHSSINGLNKVQGSAEPLIYTAYNYHSGLYTTPQLDDQNLWSDFATANALASTYFTTTKHPIEYDYAITIASQAYINVIADVGANKYLNSDGTWGAWQDSFDTIKISNVQSKTSTDPYNTIWTQPILPTNIRPGSYDTNGDGVPDTYAIAKGFAASKDLTHYRWPSGYIGVEEFLNEIDN